MLIIGGHLCEMKKHTTFYKMSFDPKKNYLWPIPADDILVNDKITQNPGY